MSAWARHTQLTASWLNWIYHTLHFLLSFFTAVVRRRQIELPGAWLNDKSFCNRQSLKVRKMANLPYERQTDCQSHHQQDSHHLSPQSNWVKSIVLAGKWAAVSLNWSTHTQIADIFSAVDWPSLGELCILHFYTFFTRRFCTFQTLTVCRVSRRRPKHSEKWGMQKPKKYTSQAHFVGTCEKQSQTLRISVPGLSRKLLSIV